MRAARQRPDAWRRAEVDDQAWHCQAMPGNANRRAESDTVGAQFSGLQRRRGADAGSTAAREHEDERKYFCVSTAADPSSPRQYGPPELNRRRGRGSGGRMDQGSPPGGRSPHLERLFASLPRAYRAPASSPATPRCEDHRAGMRSRAIRNLDRFERRRLGAAAAPDRPSTGRSTDTPTGSCAPRSSSATVWPAPPAARTTDGAAFRAARRAIPGARAVSCSATCRTTASGERAQCELPRGTVNRAAPRPRPPEGLQWTPEGKERA